MPVHGAVQVDLPPTHLGVGLYALATPVPTQPPLDSGAVALNLAADRRVALRIARYSII